MKENFINKLENKMKRNFLIAVGLVIVLGIMFTLQPLKAQVYGDYGTVKIVYLTPFEELGPDKTIIPESAFGLPPNWNQDLDDGYSYATGIDIGFPFEYNGEIYTKLWVCINGFVTFSPPPFFRSKEPEGLFVKNAIYPINVIAPFWGDHRLRTSDERFDGYMPTEISYHLDAQNGVFTVEWKNLNINDQSVKSSIADFQLKLYKSQDPLTAQGDIEFCYGQIGGNIYDPGNLVVTKGASVGIKGEGKDFLNGLEHETDNDPFDPLLARTSTRLTNEWTPSGGTEKRIRFTADLRYNIGEWWGDGDADMSKGVGRRHHDMPQNRFVTVNDARVIMHSRATKIPLDSVRKRDAYHGDVNHNGRYWWPDAFTREDIYWRDFYEGDNLPTQVPSLRAVFYQVTEYDAALILHYISARIPQLPWLLDTIPLYGKVTLDEAKATAIKFGDAKVVNSNTVSIPVYLNGYVNGPLAASFDMNSNVVSVKTADNKIASDFDGNTVILAGTGEYDSQTPVAYINIDMKSEISANNIKFNDRNVSDINLMVAGVEDNDNNSMIGNYPNPFTSTTLIMVNVPETGVYTLTIYDIMGNKVKTLASSELAAGAQSFIWDGTDDQNMKVQSGAYIYRFIGENVSLSKKLIYSK
jgi:hypothetical protein